MARRRCGERRGGDLDAVAGVQRPNPAQPGVERRIKDSDLCAVGAVTTVRYVGSVYEEITAAGVTEQRHYIFAGAERIAIYSAKSSGQSSLKYLHTDHLGSTDAVTDAAGTVIERLSYDPHGKRRNPNWTGAAAMLAGIATDRGYTGHEHLDEVGLIHMNARVYDPTLGRFLSADPIVPYPDASQSLNRYSYVNNNPLSYTDPSGHFPNPFKAVKKAFKSIVKAAAFGIVSVMGKYSQPIISIAITVVTGGNAALAFGGGFLSGMIASGGDVRAGFIGAFTAAAFAGLHGWEVQSFSLGKIFAHGLVGGASHELQGGKFGAGFLSAAFTQTLSQTPFFDTVGGNPTTWSGRIRNATAAATVGGTAAVIGGGKFANGAITGAFSRMYNDVRIVAGRKYYSVTGPKEIGDAVMYATGKRFIRTNPRCRLLFASLLMSSVGFVPSYHLIPAILFINDI